MPSHNPFLSAQPDFKPESKPASPAAALGASPAPAIVTPQVAFDELLGIASGYLNTADLPKLATAYAVALESHAGQLRKSGEDYTVHPLQVASLVAHMKLDADALVAAILHDCVEDSHLTLVAVQAQFGDTVMHLVDGLTKIENLKLASREEQQAENFRKMLLAMSRDLRVMLIKLCDRTHNMRTLASLDISRRKRIAQETMDIYAPVAHRLGLNPIYRELQDLSFAYLKPLRHATLSRALNDARHQRTTLVEQTRKKLYETLKAAGFSAQVQGREKTLYSIYRKMERKRLTFAKVSDIFGLRVVVDTEEQCYLALGLVHKAFKPQPGRIKDFIALPKPNGYQSLHTTLLGENGTQFEVQIRSQSMHRVAEGGVAAHWLYKNQAALQGMGSGLSDTPEHTMSWVRDLLELDAGGGAREFLEHVKADLFPDHVYVFTPQGKIIALPKGSTALDFAYAIHTDVGNTCFAVDVNAERVSLRTMLRTGDKITVHTSATSQPRPDWLQFAKTAKARAEIRHYMRSLNQEAVVNLGHKLLGAALATIAVLYDTLSAKHWKAALHTLNVASKEALFIDIGQGKRPPILVAQVIARQLTSTANAANPTNPNNSNNPAKGADASGDSAPAPKLLAIAGAQGIGLLYAPCCLPIPGDAVIGRLGSEGSLTVHTHDCKAVAKSKENDPDAWLELSWGDTTGETFFTRVVVDVRNGKGVLAKVASAITDAGCHISQVRTEDEPGNTAMMSFYIAVADRTQLASVYRSLRRVPHTLRVRRDGH
jgi:GTP diphosphokinase / guanosine-3',5'-bis(diphosphate) 3'-diphosphatase